MSTVGRAARRRRAFTLLEAIVAITAGGLVVTAATAVVTTQVKLTARARAERTLAREGEFASRILEMTLGAAGVGVPNGDPLVTTSSGQLSAVTFMGADTVGIFGDLPRPHAGLPTVGLLHSRPGGTQRRISWHTENNGNCVPGPCTTGNASMFFPGENGCDAAADFNDRVCPWGLRRLALGDHLLIAAGPGQWTQGQAPTAVAGGMESFSVSGNTVWFLKLAANYDDNATPDWPNDDPSANPTAIAGNSFVSTPDRVFFSHDGGTRTLRRAQCWGRINSNAGFWPPLGSASLPATLSNAPTNLCTPWEPILSNVDSVQFGYLDSAGNAAASEDAVARIDFAIRTSMTVFGEVQRYGIFGSAPVRWTP